MLRSSSFRDRFGQDGQDTAEPIPSRDDETIHVTLRHNSERELLLVQSPISNGDIPLCVLYGMAVACCEHLTHAMMR